MMALSLHHSLAVVAEVVLEPLAQTVLALLAETAETALLHQLQAPQ